MAIIGLAGGRARAARRRCVLFWLAFALQVVPAHAAPVRLAPLHEHGRVLRRPILPMPFRGHWSEDAAECDTPPVEDDQVRITGRSVDYYETDGRITRVALAGSRRAVVTLRSESEGTEFVAKKRLSLSHDGAMLTIRDQDDSGATRFRRCPAHGASREP
jgi:hypothetical protein